MRLSTSTAACNRVEWAYGIRAARPLHAFVNETSDCTPQRVAVHAQYDIQHATDSAADIRPLTHVCKPLWSVGQFEFTRRCLLLPASQWSVPVRASAIHCQTQWSTRRLRQTMHCNLCKQPIQTIAHQTNTQCMERCFQSRHCNCLASFKFRFQRSHGRQELTCTAYCNNYQSLPGCRGLQILILRR
jgi:hypothetical protein